MDFMVANSVIAGIGSLVATVCWIVLWLKTGHGAGWAVLGAAPLVLQLLPALLLGTGIVAIEEFATLNMLGTLLFTAYFLFFTFKRWPIQTWKSEEVFE